MLGYRFMGNAHSRALGAVRQLGAALEPRLVSLSGRDAAALEEARTRLGWAEASIAAARASKHVLCEKPLALSPEEAHAMWRAAEDAGVVHATGFNYRFV